MLRPQNRYPMGGSAFRGSARACGDRARQPGSANNQRRCYLAALGRPHQTAYDDHGRFRLAESAAGSYVVVTRKAGFKAGAKTVTLPRQAARPCDLLMESQQALTVPVVASRLRPQNGLSASGTNKYTLTARDITNLPEGESTPLNQVKLQMPGVALDQNQEIHIRGEHMGIQYQMNGIMLPLDINTDPTFTQLLNAYVILSVSLMDGVLPAQYGYRTSGVIDIHTKDGCDSGHNNFTVSGGQRDTTQAVFQLGGCGGDFSYYALDSFSNRTWASAPVPARRGRSTARLIR
jgi:hypothetical protein